jgi:hypothetical protein
MIVREAHADVRDLHVRSGERHRRPSGSPIPSAPPEPLCRPMKEIPSPSRISATDRLGEIAEILAAGLIRMRGRMSSPFLPTCGEISLDLNARQSGPEPNSPREIRP